MGNLPEYVSNKYDAYHNPKIPYREVNKKAMKEHSHINMYSLSTIPHHIMSHIKNHINLKSLIKKKIHISKKNHTRKKNHINKKNHIRKKNHINKKNLIRKKNHISKKNHINKKNLTKKKNHINQMIPMNLTRTNHQKEVRWNIITIDRPNHTVGQYDGCAMVMVFLIFTWLWFTHFGHGVQGMVV